MDAWKMGVPIMMASASMTVSVTYFVSPSCSKYCRPSLNSILYAAKSNRTTSCCGYFFSSISTVFFITVNVFVPIMEMDKTTIFMLFVSSCLFSYTVFESQNNIHSDAFNGFHQSIERNTTNLDCSQQALHSKMFIVIKNFFNDLLGTAHH